jgi:hypothetical protein
MNREPIIKQIWTIKYNGHVLKTITSFVGAHCVGGFVKKNLLKKNLKMYLLAKKMFQKSY